MSIRKIASRILYAMGEACFLVADQISPATDKPWRDRRWKQYLRNVSRLDSYCIPDTEVEDEINGSQ